MLMHPLPGEAHLLQTQMFSSDSGTRSTVTIAMTKRRKPSCLIGRSMVGLAGYGAGVSVEVREQITSPFAPRVSAT